MLHHNITLTPLIRQCKLRIEIKHLVFMLDVARAHTHTHTEGSVVVGLNEMIDLVCPEFF